MRISEKKHAELYRSISNPITDLRIKHAMGEVIDIERELPVLENRIYKEIKETLKLKKGKVTR